jgi:hypothetical protein
MDDFADTVRSPARARWVAVVAVFGAVWGAAEMSLGAILRSASIPMHGTPMTGLGVIIMLVARYTLAGSDRTGRGTCLAIGVVAAAIVPISVTRGIVPAMIGILAAAACLEAVLWAGRPGRGRYALAGLIAAVIPLVQLLVMLAVQFGPAALTEFREILLVKQGGARLGLAGQTAATLVMLILVLSAVFGAVCGAVAWSLAKQILRRLGREAA